MSFWNTCWNDWNSLVHIFWYAPMCITEIKRNGPKSEWKPQMYVCYIKYAKKNRRWEWPIFLLGIDIIQTIFYRCPSPWHILAIRQFDCDKLNCYNKNSLYRIKTHNILNRNRLDSVIPLMCTCLRAWKNWLTFYVSIFRNFWNK